MALFSKNLQLKDEATQDERNGFSEIHPELFKLLLDRINESKNEYINTKELVVYFREQLQISDQIFKIIFNMYSNNNEFFINEESKNEAINFDGDIPK